MIKVELTHKTGFYYRNTGKIEIDNGVDTKQFDTVDEAWKEKQAMERMNTRHINDHNSNIVLLYVDVKVSVK